MVKKTAFAASTNDIRPVLTGMLFSIKDKKITCAATNSHRLAMKEVQIETGIEGSSIVPLSSIKELQRLFSDSHEMMEIGLAENFLIFKSPLCSFYTRLIEGNYPNLDTLVPNDTKTVLTLSTTLLLKEIERASLFSRDASNYNVKVELIDESKLKISSKSTDLGKIEETQQVIRLEGDTDISISLNSQFLMEALRTITDQEVSIHFSGSMRPVLITPGDKSGHMHLISPVRG
ncbi:DNA polymerase III subunit beta [Mesobacillus subterraneus]|uniref:Beta sliding clamp n=1 Tax=Mesobacillus subterraneus TaxID=285983 RepID=A0A427TMF5_9BACI|nr:DNA polymerase III subunit beta [Mesobacillus subterraneus]RSD25543.1 DNA polymerase III subunit beta [Mesobacillus subterraneus]